MIWFQKVEVEIPIFKEDICLLRWHSPVALPFLSLISGLDSHPRLHPSPSIFYFSTRHSTFWADELQKTVYSGCE